MLSAYGAVRLAAAIRWWDVLNEFNARLSPLYLSICGAVWCVAGGVFYWGIHARKRWIRFALLASAILWYVQYWFERLFFEASQTNTVFVLIVATLLPAVVIAALYLPITKSYFMQSEEHEQADQHSKTP